MKLSEMFEIDRVQVRGDEYGWVATNVQCKKGMPLKVEAFGSINFCNFAWGQNWFTPDGEVGKSALEGSLGYKTGAWHAQLIGQIDNGIFAIGANALIIAQRDGRLAVAHNDTKVVSDNEGAWDVHISAPVTGLQGQRRPNSSALDLTISGPGGIGGTLSVNLPQWLKSPRPKFTVHALPAHPPDLANGMCCIEIDAPITGSWHLKRALHVTMT